MSRTFTPEWMPVFIGGWRWVGYAYDSKGPVKSDSHGDWKPADRHPEPEEFLKALHEYSEWVAKHGEDPLEEFSADKLVYKTVTYGFQVINAMWGPVLLCWRKGMHGQWHPAEKAPKPLLDYLNVKEGGFDRRLRDFALDMRRSRKHQDSDKGWEAMLRIAREQGHVKWAKICSYIAVGSARIEVQVPTSPAKTARQIKKAARWALARDRKLLPEIFGKRAK